jgi:hypothetical protein
VQEPTLGTTQLYVLPSTSPANAAVPWAERLRWFQELAGRASIRSSKPLRNSSPVTVVGKRGRRGSRRTIVTVESQLP